MKLSALTLSACLSATKTGQRINRWLALHTCQQIIPLLGKTSIVSFTFDDAPASACTTGARLLEAHDARGTFYIAGGLTGQLEEGHACHTHILLQQLLASGHELGCHSYSHQRCDTLSHTEFELEIARNAAFLEHFGVATDTLNFAYPFGAFSLGTKQLSTQRFRSSRITGGGAHIGSADLHALKTYRLYSDPHANPGSPSFSDIVTTIAQQGGWLIVNTHDIETSPSRYGYTPQQLEAAIKLVNSAGCQIMTVSQAIDHWQALARADA